MVRADRPGHIAAAATFLAVLASAHGAAAGSTRPTSWWIDPASCSDWSTALARHITLACDAAGRTCEVRPQKIATVDARQVTLHCSGTDHWTLEAHDGTGTGLWHIEVQGDTDERLRAAALWVARSDAAMADSSFDDLPSNAKLVTPSNENRDMPPAKNDGARAKMGGISLAAQLLYVPNGQFRQPTFAMYGLGLRVMDSGNTFSWLLPRFLRLFFTVAGEYGSPGVYQDPSFREDASIARLRLGTGVTWTVPNTHDTVTLSLEGGVGYARRDSDNTYVLSGTPQRSSFTQHRALAYAQLGLNAQIPLHGDIHPFGSFGIGVTGPDSYTGVAYGTLAIGCAWNAW